MIADDEDDIAWHQAISSHHSSCSKQSVSSGYGSVTESGRKCFSDEDLEEDPFSEPKKSGPLRVKLGDWNVLEKKFASFEQCKVWLKRLAFVYRYQTESSKKSKWLNKQPENRTWRCGTHVACKHEHTAENEFTLRERGSHSDMPGFGNDVIPRKQVGIKGIFASQIDSLLQQGMPASNIFKFLHDQVAQQTLDGDHSASTDQIPALSKIQNYSQRVKSDGKLEWGYLVDVEDWARSLLVESKSEYDQLEQDQLIVIGYNRHQFKGEGVEKEAIRIVVSCKALLKNGQRQYDSGVKKCCCSDTTFNLITNDYCVAMLGCRGLRRKDGHIRAQFRPFSLCIGATESGDTYRDMIRYTVEAMQKFEDYVLIIEVSNSDHHDGELAAFIEHNPKCVRTLCWPHIARNAIEDNKKKFSPDFLDEARQNLEDIHLATSDVVGSMLLTETAKAWLERGQSTAAAKWLIDEFTNFPFHITASGQPGFAPNNNCMESRNKEIKRNYFGLNGAVPLSVFCKTSLPNAMREYARDLGVEPISLIPHGLPSRYCLDKARELLKQTTDEDRPSTVVKEYHHFKVGEVIKQANADNGAETIKEECFVFNAKKCFAHHDSIFNMTRKRAQRYLLMLRGYQALGEDGDDSAVALRRVWSEINNGCHAVTIVAEGGAVTLQMWCDCPAFYSQMECSHICAVLEIKGYNSNDTMLARIEGPIRRGRPRLDQEQQSKKAVDLLGTPVAARFDGRMNPHLGKVESYTIKEQVGSTGVTLFAVRFEPQHNCAKREIMWTRQQVNAGYELFKFHKKEFTLDKKRQWRAGHWSPTQSPRNSPVLRSPVSSPSPNRRSLYNQVDRPSPILGALEEADVTITSSAPAEMGNKRAQAQKKGGYKRRKTQEPEGNEEMRSTTTTGYWCNHCHKNTDHLTKDCGFVVREK